MNTAAIAAQRGAKTVTANGIDIVYVEAGDGPPLVLLHGALASTGPAWAGSTNAYVDHLPTLAKHFRVIAPDTRGSGATAHPGGAAGFDVLADDVIALVEALGLDRPLIVGFSEGGATANPCCAHATRPRSRAREPRWVRLLRRRHMPQQIDNGFRPLFGGRPGATAADPDAAERALQAIPPMAATFATMQADYDAAQGEGHWRTYLAQFFDRTIAGVGRTTDDFAVLTMPTWLLVGDRDMFCPVEVAAAAYRALPAGELAILPNTAHDITAQAIDITTDFGRRVG